MDVRWSCMDYKQSWTSKNWWFWTVVLEKTLESPLNCKEIQSVHPKGDQSWVFIGRNDAEAETPILQPPDAMSWLIGKDPDAGKDWGQEKKGLTEDEMIGWHHQLNGLWVWWTPGAGDGQGGLASCSSRGRKESDTTERLIWTELISSEEILVKESRGSPLWCSSGKSKYRKDKEGRQKESHCRTLPHFSSLFFWILGEVNSVIWPWARSQSCETLES